MGRRGKQYDPKTAVVVDKYMTEHPGHDRWFIPSLAPEAIMEKQLAQCKLLSPHGVGQDVNPDAPLVVLNDGSITGRLLMGDTLTGNAGEATGGLKPYSYSCQWLTSYASSNSPWTPTGDNGVPVNGKVYHTILDTEMSKYFRLDTTITDANGDKVVTNSPTWGPVQTVYPVINPFTTPVDLLPGFATAYDIFGVVAYSASWRVSYKDATDVWREMPENTSYVNVLNNEYPNLNLSTCSWAELDRPTGSDVQARLTIGTEFTSAGGITIPFKFELDDTYQSQNARATAELVVNFVAL